MTATKPVLLAGSSYSRKKFRNRQEKESVSVEERMEVETMKEEKEDTKEVSPCVERSPSQYSSSDTEHIAKKKRAMFQVTE